MEILSAEFWFAGVCSLIMRAAALHQPQCAGVCSSHRGDGGRGLCPARAQAGGSGSGFVG